MNTTFHPAEDMQRVAEVRARAVARQQRKRIIGNVIEWMAFVAVVIPPVAILVGVLMTYVAPDALAAALP